MPVDDINPDYLLTNPASTEASITVRPKSPERKPLTRDEAEKLVRKYNPDITPAAVQGEVDNIIRESSGNPADDTGDHGTSGGLYQHHNTRLDGLKEFAAKEKADWKDPDIQVRYARLEKERDYPALLKFQQTTDDPRAAEDQFKRVFERPASVLWQNGSDGQPVTAAGRFRVSEYAMDDARRQRGDIHLMSPVEYLDLAPALEGKPFDSPSGRSLMRSVGHGDQIEAVPTLETKVDGPTATVTDQDGRHRALLAQQEGVEAIPVRIQQTGTGTPTEIVGQSGKIMAHDFPKAEGYQAPKPPDQSAFRQIANALGTPRAEAAEPQANWWNDYTKPQQEAAPPSDQWWTAYTGGAPPSQKPEPDNAALSFAKGAARGFGETALAGQQLVGRGMEAVGIPGGSAVAQDANQGIARLEQEADPDRAAHPVASGIGDFGGSMVLPAVTGGLAANALGAGAAGMGALQGGLAGLLSPGGGEHFWRDKAMQLLTGAGVGAAAGKAGNALAGFIAPKLRPFIEKLMGEGVELTPGMMAGGIAKSIEDRATSIPITGDAIQAARRRAFEQFNRAAWNRALEPIGEAMPPTVPMGREAADYVGDRLSAAYRRILPNITIRADPADPPFAHFLGDLSTITRDARALLPDAQFGQFERFVRSQIEQKLTNAGGMIDGNTANGIDSMLGSEARGYARSQEHDARKLGDALGEVQAAFRNLMEQQNPGPAGDALRMAREGWANYVRVAKAASMQGTATREGIFSPAQLNAAVRSENNTTRKLGYARGKAMLQDLSDAGQAVLPSQYPDSGTAGRLLLGGGAFGLAELLGHPEALLGLLAGAAPYTAPASKAVNWAANRLAQPASPARNALAGMTRIGAQIAPPVAGSAAAMRFANPAQSQQQ